jgi:hypothetical protein
MFERTDPWTTALVIFVSLIAVKIGIDNLQWGLKTVSNAVIQMNTGSNNPQP